ncbi:DUF4054 domain-containing protein [Aliarcobacter cryaerophilus]|uniref:DUF4054 domain-containing protein n=1 Tax=Aliarcobacter cryaerophilus TaxID=28198 RepID=UPI003DA3B226
MSMIDDLKAKFPMIPAQTINTYFPMYEKTYKCYYGADYGLNSCDDEAILYLLAHLITVANLSALTGATPSFAVASESVDGVSTSYVVPTNMDQSDTFFLSTIYGQMFKMIISNNGGAIFV